jgi:hypothetical protein
VRNGIRFSVLAGLVLAVFAAWPSESVAAKGGTARPIQGSATGAVTGVLPSGEVVLDYTGTATHLGRCTRRELLTIEPDFTVHGTIVYVAADGDELELDFAGAFVSPTTVTGTYTFTGGTGRFAGATGTATFEAVTLDGIHVDATFQGTISY